MKNIIIVFLVVLILGSSAYFIMNKPSSDAVIPPTTEVVTTTEQQTPQQTPPVKNVPVVNKTETVLGTSVSGNNITAYHYGEGSTELLFIGGIHGGYEWNTVLVAYQLMDYLKANPNSIPKNVKVTVIPVLNPDGLKKVTGSTGRFTKADVSTEERVITAGRFNTNTVDLNRNFDCDWKKTGVWQTKPVSGGTSAFSEPESQAIKSYVDTNKPTAVVVWYSAAGGVFASSCHNGVSTETSAITKKFAAASGYPAYESFDFYATSGDMVNWFAKNNTPAISVILTNHTDTEWSKNLAGIKALLTYYTK
ncbi:MAG: hypothetical protein KBB50_01960 [Candidatus Pacebacteria bacterium]|nr:hypothetical protein [Candidatus Paceibacterota bacterium]